MPLPTPLWKVNVNGLEGQLTFDAAPNQQGLVTGDILGSELHGLWDEVSQTISFTARRRNEGAGAFPNIASFKGYLFRTPSDAQPGQDTVATLAGFVQMTDGNLNFGSGISRRNVFGWFAQISEVL